jgi:hypothetical protein
VRYARKLDLLPAIQLLPDIFLNYPLVDSSSCISNGHYYVFTHKLK